MRTKTTGRRTAPAKRGFVLMCVLWVLAILTVVTLGFGRRVMLERRASAYSMDYAQAKQMARGAIEVGRVKLANRRRIDEEFLKEDQPTVGQRLYYQFDLKNEGYFDSLDDPDMEGDTCYCELWNEAARIDLNYAPEEVIEKLPGLDRRVLRSILMRRETTGDERPRPFRTTEELRLIDGVDDEVWYGDGRTPALKDLVTCHGSRSVNVNAASADVLACIPGLSRAVSNSLIEFRAGPDGELYTEDDRAVKDWDDLAARVGMPDAQSLESLRKYCTTESYSFTIVGFATRRQGKIRVYCASSSGVSVVPWLENASSGQWREGYVALETVGEL